MAVAEKVSAATAPLFPPDGMPTLYVLISCQRCFQQKHLLLTEGWDITDVVHDCEGEPAFTLRRK